jgi:serine/threonine-protein kinase RsbT
MLGVRALLRAHSRRVGFSLVDETKLITAGSEIARNILKYAGDVGGQLVVQELSQGGRNGLRAVFSDRGPGIADVAMAMTDGYSTGGSLGIGLPGARRLVDEFDLKSVPREGTTVTLIKWKH